MTVTWLSCRRAGAFRNICQSAQVEQAYRYVRNLCYSMDEVLTMSDYHRQSFIQNFDISPDRVVNSGCGVNV